LEEKPAKKESQQPVDDNTSDGQTRQPVDDQTPGTQVQQAAPIQSDKKTEALNTTPGMTPFPEKKIIIYFKHNSNELPDQSFETLNRIAEFLQQNPSASIDIKGYTDSTGSYSYNVSVSEFRANTIKTYLAGKGVPASRIKSVGLGPENPIATNSTEEGRRKNRRVEIELNFE